jgi:hypothetical protein
MHNVVKVKTHSDFILELWFKMGEHRYFDMKPYLGYPAFQPLQDKQLFDKAFVALDTVCWPGDLDMSPDTIFLCSYEPEAIRHAA